MVNDSIGLVVEGLVVWDEESFFTDSPSVVSSPSLVRERPYHTTLSSDQVGGGKVRMGKEFGHKE